MAWINIISYENSFGKLRNLYDRIKGPNNNIDNIMMVHSLRPHTLEGHMVIYKNVLHHAANENPKWFLELIGVWVSKLNQCDYCEKHHYAGLRRLLGDEKKLLQLKSCLASENFQVSPLTRAEILALEYAKKLTAEPGLMKREMVESLSMEGFSDGKILEINQVVSYFNYANRTVLGLGCNTNDDILGLSPGNSSNPNDWSHT